MIEILNTHKIHNIMENKSNDATSQRPEGDRILNASLVGMSSLNKYKVKQPGLIVIEILLQFSSQRV